MKHIVDAAWEIPVPGTIVAGKYVVETECGRDGLAAILSAIQLGLERRVVIRVLLPEWADDPQAIEQFRRDGRAAARAASDASPRIFDSGKLDSGAPFQVLDYLGEHEFAPVGRSTSPDPIRGVAGSDRVVASALLMLGALGTAAFMWLYSTVHENDNKNLGATLMQPTTNILDDGGVDAPTAVQSTGSAAAAAMDAGVLATSRVTQGGVDAGPFGDDAAPARAALPPLVPVSLPVSPVTRPASEARIQETRSEPRVEALNAADPRPQRTVVHVEPNPTPAPTSESPRPPATQPGAGVDTTNPYAGPSPDAPPARTADDSPRARDAGAQTPSDDNGPASEDQLLDHRE
jgi:hypothetical protein